MVGYNRRFAPFVRVLRQHLQPIQESLLLTYRLNAGYLPPDHWLHDPAQGGGRLIGEGSHFVDYLIGRGPQPMRFADIVISTRAVLGAQRSLETGKAIWLEEVHEVDD